MAASHMRMSARAWATSGERVRGRSIMKRPIYGWSAGVVVKAGDKAPAFSLEDQQGKTVKLSDFKGRKLLVLEAMKMEQALLAPFDGLVAELKAVVGAQVSEGALLARIAPAED